MRAAVVLGALVAPVAGAESLDLENETTRINYSLGYQIGGDFERQGVELDADAVVQGIRDALSGGEPQLSQPEMHETLVELKKKILAEERSRTAERELTLLAEGKRFLEENAGKPGVVTTESGLQYRIVEPGSDKRPGPRDQVTCNYTGRLVNGNKFDSSGDEPATFHLDGVIAGWTEGLQLIGEGGKIELFVPQNLAYRDRGPLAHRTLVFDIELLAVGGPE
jgi:FKBP-type peptidyl-prolyl cis-trans isomerase FklB